MYSGERSLNNTASVNTTNRQVAYNLNVKGMTAAGDSFGDKY